METGTVLDVKKNNVLVKMTRKEACAHCGACTKEMLIEAKNTCQAASGDIVQIALNKNSFLLAVLVMYLVPFSMLMIGFFLGMSLAPSLGLASYAEVAGFFTGLLLAGCSYILISRFETYFKQKGFQPEAVGIVKHS